jgi:hypothetical protein
MTELLSAVAFTFPFAIWWRKRKGPFAQLIAAITWLRHLGYAVLFWGMATWRERAWLWAEGGKLMAAEDRE